MTMMPVGTYNIHFTLDDIERFERYAYGGFSDFKTIIDIARDYVTKYPERYCFDLRQTLSDGIYSNDSGFVRGIVDSAVRILNNHCNDDVYFKLDNGTLRLCNCKIN